ncbi:17734_t:CDS:2 [Funneliformis caledonium]|uniref:17734_t:CDS:1 n=1 Tax=Funneliformis caledonium TaxID=1117310 RepID=A0A9N8ZWQ8_9GLOM|nr:17734_t:CDS:2 [Funneliformis caledonium]
MEYENKCFNLNSDNTNDNNERENFLVITENVLGIEFDYNR